MDNVHEQYKDKVDFYVLDVDSVDAQPILQVVVPIAPFSSHSPLLIGNEANINP